MLRDWNRVTWSAGLEVLADMVTPAPQLEVVMHRGTIFHLDSNQQMYIMSIYIN